MIDFRKMSTAKFCENQQNQTKEFADDNELTLMIIRKMAKITVDDSEITVVRINDEDYLSLTDMMKAHDGEFFFHNWLRNRNTIEFLGIWEKVYNPNFNSVEFDRIKSMAGLNNFRISAKEWIESTNAIGLVSKAGRYY